MVRRLAMAHPEVAFTLNAATAASSSTSPRQPAEQRIGERIMGRDFIDKRCCIAAERDGIGLSGLAGLPTFIGRDLASTICSSTAARCATG